jgi:hypothetical protein
MAEGSTFVGEAGGSRDRTLPINIPQNKLLSTTDHAAECFVQQKFSSELQKFLINYNLSITGYNSLHV